MRPRGIASALFLFNCGQLIAGIAAAQSFPNELRQHYRFMPRLSVLNETGGIYPRDTDFRVFGTFDWVDTTVNPVGDGMIRFRNVEAWASHPILAYVLDLNNVLGMSGLIGYQLPVLAPFDVYKFEGKASDGSHVDLFASVIGPWLRLRGGTTPPEGSADMFVYRLSAVARKTPFADFNIDDEVDDEDLARWMTRFGASPSLGDAMHEGDANGDDLIDGSDLLVWQLQLGDVAPPVASLDAMMDAAIATIATASTAAVPEPATLVVIALGAGILAICRKP